VRKAMDYLPRRAAELVLEALTDTRVVVVNGARQVGKSTLAEVVLRQTKVLGELARQLTWSRVSARLFHYRDRDQYEVDAVLEDNAGQVIAVEVKAAETVRTDDFRGLRLLKRRLGDRFRAGFVLYCGAQSLAFGDGLTCLPISALWTTSASRS